MPISVSIVAPVSGSTIPGPATSIILSATVVSTLPVDNVEFFYGSNSIGQVTPIISSYGPIVTGTVALTNGLPAVVGAGTSFLADFAVNDFVIFSSQPDAIYQVALVGGNTSITLSTPFTGTTTAATTMRAVTLFGYYSLSWNNVDPGGYTLTAVATDITGATAVSTAVTVNVSGVIGAAPSSRVSGSSIGFGHNPFGSHEFGVGDWAEEMLWKNMPEVYKDCDLAGPDGSAVQQPLRTFQNALKPSYQDIRIKWGQFPSLWDAVRTPVDQLPQLGYNVGLEVDSTKNELLQRSSILNASQLWINKGTDKGYQITAAFEGLLVDVTPLWAKSCAAASQLLGIATSPFDLSTTAIYDHPVSPGTLHIRVTNSAGVVEDIYDDENGNLVGYNFTPYGIPARLNYTQAVTLNVNTIVGIFHVGDTVTQSLSSGVVIASLGGRVTISVTAGTFGTGPVTDTTSGATAVVTSTATNELLVGETIVGETSGTTAVVRVFDQEFMVIDRITKLNNFSPIETLRGLTSGNYAVSSSFSPTTLPLVAGPLRWKLVLTGVVGPGFNADDEITGGTSGSVAIVRSGSGTIIYVDTMTEPGLDIGEVITSTSTTATIVSISAGSINYLTGELTGNTVNLLSGSRVESVVDLIPHSTMFVANYDEVIGDEIPMDRIETDRYARWPTTYYPIRIVNGILTPGECRSHSLRLFFYTPDDTEIEDFTSVAQRVTRSLETFRPLHVRFDRISFDGSRSSSQVWRTGPIVTSSSAASVWVAPVVGNMQASSQVWTTGPFTATVAT